MLRKILAIYQNSILFPARPEHPPDHLYIFFDEQQNEWVGIPKKALSENELALLKALYTQLEFPMPYSHSTAEIWHEFLMNNDHAPSGIQDKSFRFIHFYINGNEADQSEIESALKGFLTEDVIIFWENANLGVVVEEQKHALLAEKEIMTLSETLESDFYVKISFYIGKVHMHSEGLPAVFQQEKDYFLFGLKYLKQFHIYSLERILPAFAVHHLPIDIREKILAVASVFHEDEELFLTIKTFLENNSNASLTAKKLYIHRNTLQYRIDKFIEKSGIALKDFYGAITVFLACLLFELEYGF